MSEFIQWLLGLQQIRLSEGGPLSLRFATPPAPWIMLAGAVLAGVIVHRIYRRESLAARRRWVLFALRMGTVMTVLFILGQPILVLRRNHVDRSRVSILIDRSLSMNTHDGAGDRSIVSPPVTRWDAAVDLVGRPTWGCLASLLSRRHQVDVWTFAESPAAEISLDEPSAAKSISDRFASMRPDGNRTNIAGALDEVLSRSQGAPLAATVLISDGRQTQSTLLDAAIAQAQTRSAPIHVIAVGSSRAPRDLSLDSAICEEEVYLRDAVTIHARASGKGFEQPVEAELQLRDKSTGELLSSKRARLGAKGSTPVDLTYHPARAGRRVLTVSVVPREDEENEENNVVEVLVNARDEKIAVLYVEGRPRFEYRYLKNMLLREQSIESSCLLLTATPGFAQEGTKPIRRFPQSVEELRAYDVIILGDVDPRSDWISPVQMAMLSDFVTLQGAGIAFIAGEGNSPHGFRQTGLEKLLPVRVDPEFGGRYDRPLTEAFAPALTLEGRQCNLFSMDMENAEDEWIGEGSGWYWFARVLGPQPAASVLLAHPTAAAGGQAIPLAVLGRAGAGRTFYLGSDDPWRWRQTAGEGPYEAFWLRVIRTLARGRKLGTDCPWRLETERRTCEVGERVRVHLTCMDRAIADDVSEVGVQVSESQRGLVDRLVLHSIGAGTRELEGEFTSNTAGHFVLTPTLPTGVGNCKNPEARLDVWSTDYERLHPEADFEFLRMIAARTGGKFLRAGDDLASLAESIPDRSVQIPDDLEEPLWDKPAMLVLFAVLIVLEWTLRKSAGLT